MILTTTIAMPPGGGAVSGVNQKMKSLLKKLEVLWHFIAAKNGRSQKNGLSYRLTLATII
jgi:hypothetical protein